MGATAATHVKRCLRAAQPGAIPCPAPAPDFERHRRKCAICNHPEREAIEELFIYWHSAGSIKRLFDLPDWSAIYRHAHAVGLYELRRRNVRFVLDLLLEGVDGVEATPMSIVNAVRAYACLTDSGAWVEPTRRLLLTTTHVSSTSAPLADPPSSPSPVPPRDSVSPRPERSPSSADSERSQSSLTPRTSNIEPSTAGAARPAGHPSSPTSDLRLPTSSSPNRQSPELEMPVSHSKQSTGPRSNRQISPHAQRELPLAQKCVANVPKR